MAGSTAFPAPSALAGQDGAPGVQWRGTPPLIVEPASFPTGPGGAFAASLVLPGAGQAALGLRRWPLYVAVEAGFWWLWADSRGDFRTARAGYRDVAWERARIQEGERRDAGWPYYEAMSHYLESGRFDADAAAGIQPETDPATYNGSVWAIAQGLYLPGGVPDPGSPEHDAALAWYEGRAAGPGYLWSWTGREADLVRFRGLISAADDARRQQSAALGVILANHLISAIDALVAARLKATTGADLTHSLVPDYAGPKLRVGLRFPLKN